jgi:hypothetical protein
MRSQLPPANRAPKRLMAAPDDPAASSPAAGPPRPVSAADRETFDALVKDSFSSVRSMAAAWRTGLTALITLVTTGIIITGRTATTTLTVPWRIVITLAIGGGLALAIVGLWYALAAEVGARVRLQTLDEIRAQYASVQAYLVGQAAIAARRLQAARVLVGGALAFLVPGVLLTWWAPAAPDSPPAYLRVTLRGGTVCGTLQSADGGVLRLAVAGAYKPATIPLASVTNLAVVATCS